VFGGGGCVPSQLLVTSLCAMTLSIATAAFTGLTFLVRIDLLVQLRRQFYDEREKRKLWMWGSEGHCIFSGKWYEILRLFNLPWQFLMIFANRWSHYVISRIQLRRDAYLSRVLTPEGHTYSYSVTWEVLTYCWCHLHI